MSKQHRKMPQLVIGDFAAPLPIIQGGMGVGVSGVSLASAVANQGGIGVLSAAGLGCDERGYIADPVGVSNRALRDQIRQARERSGGLLGINIMAALSNFAEMVKTSIEEKIDFVFVGAGLPLDLPKYLPEHARTKLIPIVSSAKAARLICHRWATKYHHLPGAIVVEGPLAGGHLGFKKEQIDDADYALERLIPQVIAEVTPIEEQWKRKIPVVAAGGIYTGEDIRRFIDLGASGVQMGTRFVTTDECDASAAFKNSYIQCSKEDIEIIDSPVGMPGRAIRNDFIASVKNGERHPVNCPYHCIQSCDVENSPYCIARALLNAKKGNMDNGFAFAGQNAYRANGLISVGALVDSLSVEYERSR